MRLHRLTATAFGPFADTVSVDLDEVGADGIFLIRGATGAGKTSLLDAICFALFADLPGARTKKGLHSDHAERGTVPSVELELTAAGRRLRVERSPEFRRPKARGTGEVSVPAKAQLWELRDGDWQALSTRHDEIAEVVDDVLGMGLAQFSKVVLLPQGDFATFLRATPEERRALLERLFDVAGFVGIEEWFAKARKDSAADVEETRRELRTVLTLVSEQLAGSPVSVVDSGDDEDGPGGTDLVELEPALVPAALNEVIAGLEGAAAESLTALDEARGRAEVAGAALSAGRQCAATQARGRGAAVTLAELDEAAEAHDEVVTRVDAATRAAPVAGELSALTRAAAALESARAVLASTSAGTAPLGCADATASSLAELDSRMVESGALLADAARAGGTLERLATQVSRHDAQVTRDSERARAVVAALDDLTTRRSEVESRLATAAAAEQSLTRARQDVEALRRQQTLRAENARDESTLATHRSRHHELISAEQDARDTYLDLREARLDGMAAELAAGLADDEPCPVCGAADHPTPATAERRVAAEDVATAEAAWHTAQTASRELGAVITALEATVAQRSAEVIHHDDLEATLGVREAALDVLETEAAGRPALSDALATLDDEGKALTDEAAALRESIAGATAARTEVTAEIEQVRAAVALALEEHAHLCPCASGQGAGPELPADMGDLTVLADVRRRHDAAALALEAHLDALRAVEQRTEDHAAAVAAVEAAVSEAGFADADELSAALLPPATLAQLRSAVADRDRARAVATATLAEDDVLAAMQLPEPDLDALETAASEATGAVTSATSTDALVRASLTSVRRMATTVTTLCDRLSSSGARADAMRELADTLAGLGPNNALRMRLSAFVLAARLEKVAELANERLASMGGGRYQLRHSDGLAARGARSGLGLDVLDLWTGQTRATSSLSGGESFMASLALALGLADAVREEAGGFDLQTLFIDEGFGTLDDESLEQVLDVLDGLREGGRAVGVVSHVAELRTRITNQVVVTKTEHGSSVRTIAAGSTAEPAA